MSVTLFVAQRNWRFASAAQAEALFGLKAKGRKALSLKDTFRFECKSSGGCCWHFNSVACSHNHVVGSIQWELKGGVWKCPYLSEDKLCSIYMNRPVVCKFYPLDVDVISTMKMFVAWTIDKPTRCLECYDGKRWRVSEWLMKNGFRDWAEKIIGDEND